MLKIVNPTKVLLGLFLILISCKNTGKPDIKAIVTDYHKKGAFNGALLVVKNDIIICDTVLGYNDFIKKRKLDQHTAFYIASLSKPFTAVGIVLLEQEKKLSFEDKASKYVNGLPGYAQNISIRQLLTHTSGIKDYEAVLSNRKGLTNNDVINWLHKQQKLQFQPGSQFEYSNTGYIILSLVIENISGQTYGQFLKENVFVPLGMKNTIVYDQSKPVIANKAIGFNKNKEVDDYSILTTGDGGIYATVDDLYQLVKALKNHSLINKENTALLYHRPVLQDGKPSEYGFGWFVDDSGNKKIVSHTGGLNGFRSLFWSDLQNNITIIALTNQGDAFPLQNFLDDIRKSVD